MALPASGKMSLNMIKGEFGGVTPIAISKYYRGRGLVPTSNGGIPASGVIKWSDFYGGTAVPPIPTLRKTYTPGTYSVVIPTGVYIMKFVMVAGGGGGGGGREACGGCDSFGSGGGGGGYQSQLINVTPNETLTLIVGAAGGTKNAGGDTILKRGGTALYITTGGGFGGSNGCRCWNPSRPGDSRSCAPGGDGGLPNGGDGRTQSSCGNYNLGGTSYSTSLGYGGGAGAGMPGMTELWW
jgi:hypothetical protein